MGRWEVSEVAMWENGEAKSWEVPGFLKGGGHKTSSRFHLFVSDVNLGNEGVEWVQDFLVWPQGWKDSP